MNGRCIDCAHAALRDKDDLLRDRTLREFARLGCVNCLKSLHRSSFVSFSGTCHLYREADPEIIAARQKWIEAQAQRVSQPSKIA